LLERLARRFKDGRLLQLFERIIRAFRAGLGQGLPIGSLTSQHFANFYLGRFDRFVKERLRIKGYVRYMDDMALWGVSKDTLRAALAAGELFLAEELGLRLKPFPYLNRTEHGMDFLGCRLFSDTHAPQYPQSAAVSAQTGLAGTDLPDRHHRRAGAATTGAEPGGVHADGRHSGNSHSSDSFTEASSDSHTLHEAGTFSNGSYSFDSYVYDETATDSTTTDSSTSSASAYHVSGSSTTGT
jgi:hypothetical protein